MRLPRWMRWSPRSGLDSTRRASTGCDVVLVTGPWLAGVTGVVAALTERLPDQKFVESTDLQPGEAPTAVVFVVSAAASLTESDCALLDAATAETDAVIGAVSKIDVHRNWEEVLASNREVLTAHARALSRRAVGRGGRRARTVNRGSTTLPPRYPIELADTDLAAPKQVAGVELPAPDRRRQARSRCRWRRAGGRGSRRCGTSAARSCGSGGCPSPSGRSRCAAKPSRRGFSCPTSPATAVPRCAPSCRKTPRA